MLFSHIVAVHVCVVLNAIVHGLGVLFQERRSCLTGVEGRHRLGSTAFLDHSRKFVSTKRKFVDFKNVQRNSLESVERCETFDFPNATEEIFEDFN